VTYSKDRLNDKENPTMKFELSEDQALLKTSTREMLESESPVAQSRAVMEDNPDGYAKKLYADLGELGYLGILRSEDGGGMGAIAFAAVLSEMGRVAFPGPFLEVALAVRALEACDSDAATGWLDSVSAGEKIVVMARGESVSNSDASSIECQFAGGQVRGTKVFVPFGAQADALLVETAQGIALVERPDAGWNATALTTFDHSQRFASIELDDPGVLVAEGEKAQQILSDASRLGALGAAAVMLGCMESALEASLKYTTEREAFGVPIGSFQGLQHRAADMLIKTESSRAAIFRAAWAEEEGESNADYLVSVAKAWTGPSGRFVCGQSIQLHGGVGYTWEYDMHMWFKRVKTLEQFYGSTRAHTEAAVVNSPVT
jgi:alkylation response protein AidB-like acyl-CoA dehydrogenase